MDACPPLEDIAAFLDDMLSAEERERITEHLARCESCYEIFAGAVHFQVEEEKEKRDSSAEDTGGRGVLPFPLKGEEDRAPRRIPQWLPLAASVILVAGLGFVAWQSFVPPKITVAGLVEPLEEQPRIVESLYEPTEVMRGGEKPVASYPIAPPFLAGVYLIDLRLSIQARDVEKTENALYDLSSELDQIRSMIDLAAKLRMEAGQMKDVTALQRFEPTLPQWESDLQEFLSKEPFFSFGLWTEAGRLSAVTGSPEFFEKRANRRFISFMEREIRAVQDERYEPILKNLRQIEDDWAKAEGLSENFQEIIDQIERIQKEDQEDPLSESLDPSAFHAN